MSASPTWPRWFGRLKAAGAARRRATPPDFADHGTAYGLDLSLSQLARSEPLLPTTAASDDKPSGSSGAASRTAR
jgi:hypothetical protein